jgi:hypothetical protein
MVRGVRGQHDRLIEAGAAKRAGDRRDVGVVVDDRIGAAGDRRDIGIQQVIGGL